MVATATALTARSIAEAVKRFVLRRPSTRHSAFSNQQNRLRTFSDYVVSGGGARNRMLVNMLRAELGALGLTLRSSDEFGVPSAAKEAVAFALLAYETWHRRPSNIPAATGARRPAILGKISYA